MLPIVTAIFQSDCHHLANQAAEGPEEDTVSAAKRPCLDLSTATALNLSPVTNQLLVRITSAATSILSHHTSATDQAESSAAEHPSAILKACEALFGILREAKLWS